MSFCGKMYRDMTKGIAQFVGILATTTVGMRRTSNEHIATIAALPSSENNC